MLEIFLSVAIAICAAVGLVCAVTWGFGKYDHWKDKAKAAFAAVEKKEKAEREHWERVEFHLQTISDILFKWDGRNEPRTGEDKS